MQQQQRIPQMVFFPLLFCDGDPFSSHISRAIYEQRSFTYCYTNDVIFMRYMLFNTLCASLKGAHFD